MNYDGTILVSGSRSIKGYFPFATMVWNEAVKRNWIVTVGDADGVDFSIIQLSIVRKLPVIVCGDNRVGLRLTPIPSNIIPKLYFTANYYANYTKRDQFMIDDIVKDFENKGFLMLWDKTSTGTRKSFEYAVKQGIKGILFGINDENKLEKLEIVK